MTPSAIPEPEPWRDPAWQRQTRIMLDSFRRFVGRELIAREGDAEQQARNLFEAPFVVAAHNTESDPILNYGNRAALRIWEMDLETFLKTPSRHTAEPMARDERARMLAQAAEQGFFDNYRGIRIASSGRRFEIRRAIVWNIVDKENRPAGQGATFSDWSFLDEQGAEKV